MTYLDWDWPSPMGWSEKPKPRRLPGIQPETLAKLAGRLVEDPEQRRPLGAGRIRNVAVRSSRKVSEGSVREPVEDGRPGDSGEPPDRDTFGR